MSEGRIFREEGGGSKGSKLEGALALADVATR